MSATLPDDTLLEECGTCQGHGLLPDNLCPDCGGAGYVEHGCERPCA